MFRGQPGREAKFAAAPYPYHATTRLDEVSAEHNLARSRLLKEYERAWARAILPDASLNWHGEPIVSRAAEAGRIPVQKLGVCGVFQRGVEKVLFCAPSSSRV